MDITFKNHSGVILGSLVRTAKRDEITLTAGDLVRLDQRHPTTRLQVMSGRVWITRSGDPQDYLLETGSRFNLEKSGTILVEGMTDARLRVEA